MPALTPETRFYFIKLALLAAGYVSVVYLSLYLVPAGGSGASLAWPPSAVALMALFLFGSWRYPLWPALLLPFFILLLMQGQTPLVAAAVAGANTLEAFVGSWMLRYWKFDPMFNRLRDAVLLAAAAFVSALAGATAIAVALGLIGTGQFNASLWSGIWIGHAVSLISIAPLLLRWGCKPTFTRTRTQWAEGIVGFGLLAVCAYLVYWTPFTTLGPVSLLYVSVIILIWAALRTGPRGVSLALLMMASIAVSGVLFGGGPLTNTSQTLFSIQLVVGVLSLIFLLFGSIVEENKESSRLAREHAGALEEALERVRLEDQAKSDFIAILAHELRNPLSPILSGIELLKIERKGSPEVLLMMGAHINNIARLLDDLLDLSRINQKKFKLQKEAVKLSEVLNQSLEMVSPHMTERGHSLTTLLPEEELWIDADPVRLSQIFVNLLTNAAKYTDPGGRIRLEVRREGNEAAVEVTDTGVGIEPARMRKIFEAFGASDTAVPRMGGLHIGLSLAKRMAELHSGALQAHSEGPGRGSRFTVRLPLLPTAPMLPTGEERRRGRFARSMIEEVQRLKPLSILVVDDNESAADSLGKLLEHTGHRPTLAYNAEQALSICEANQPQVALLDIGLPDMDGYELAGRLRQKFGDTVYLVALTGYGQSEDKERAMRAGFDEHLTKPVSIVDVERVLSDLRRDA